MRDAVVKILKENLTVLATVRVVQVIQPAARVVPAVQAALAPPVITESKKHSNILNCQKFFSS